MPGNNPKHPQALRDVQIARTLPVDNRQENYIESHDRDMYTPEEYAMLFALHAEHLCTHQKDLQQMYR